MAHAFGLAALVVLGTWLHPIAALAEDRAASATTVEDPDDIFWSAVKDSRTEYPIRVYLENYPHGRHHVEAEARLKALAAPAAVASPPPSAPAAPPSSAPAAAAATPPPLPPPAPAVEAMSGTYFTKSATVLRDAPQQAAKSLRRVRKGEKLTATGRTSDKEWIRIGGSHEGWVDAAALDDEATVEAKEWAAAGRTQRQDVLRRYLAQFPDGAHAAEARQRLAGLAAAARAAQAEAKQRAAQEAAAERPDRTASERPSPPSPEDGPDRAALQSVLKDLRASDSSSSPPAAAPMAAAPAVAAAATLAALGASPIEAPASRPSPTPSAGDAAGSSVMASAAANALAVDGSRGAIQPPPGGVESSPSTLPAGDLVARYDAAVGLLGEGQDGRAEQALEALSRAARSGSLAANVRYRLGDLYFKQGNYPRAAAEIQAAYDIDPAGPNAPEARRKLAVALAHTGQRGAACAQLKEIAKTYRGMIAGYAEEIAADQQEVGCPR